MDIKAPKQMWLNGKSLPRPIPLKTQAMNFLASLNMSWRAGAPVDLPKYIFSLMPTGCSRVRPDMTPLIFVKTLARISGFHESKRRQPRS